VKPRPKTGGTPSTFNNDGETRVTEIRSGTGSPREDRGFLECRNLAAESDIGPDRGAGVVDAELRRALVEHHEPVVRERQRPQEVAVEHAEHRRVRADREREDDDREGGRGRALGERAQRLANVLQHRAPALLAPFFVVG
jgi:hypothetical protein